MIRAAPWGVTALMALPVAAGLAGAVLPAFGYFPALGGTTFSLAPWQALLDWPGIGAAVRLSLVTGVGATVLSLAITLLVVAAWQGTRSFRAATSLLAPLLALPHAAAAFGLAFLIAPSGWIARALSPWGTGWDRPPDLLLVNDPNGYALMAGLVLKEVPFLMLMTLAALGQTDSARRMAVARALGYGRVTAWAKTVLPAVYTQIRLPVFAVLAYSMSVVDVALILGPTRPPTLSVQVLEWMTAPDLSLRFTAAAGAVLQLLLVLGALGTWVLAERLVARRGQHWAAGGARGQRVDGALRMLATIPLVGIALAVGLGLAGLALWSVAGLWRFPDIVPQGYTGRVWAQQSSQVISLGTTTFLLGVYAAAIALVLSIASLQAGKAKVTTIIYLPLLVPQIAFLPGLSTLGLWTGLDGSFAAVLVIHLVFVLPYVALSLSDPWHAWDRRAGLVAASLGAGPWRVLYAVRLPMLVRPLCIAFAVGFATSVAQYLPTLLIGAGRVSTLTTEAVALAASGNRRLIGVWAVVQMALPMLVFAVALVIPAMLARRRQGLRVT
jgi:putative thiamine transport system permease protein